MGHRSGNQAVGTPSACCTERSGQQRCVVDLVLVDEHVRVGVPCHCEVPLSNELADPGLWLAAQVLERDAAVTQIVWRDGGYARGAGAGDRRPKAVRSDTLEDPALGSALVAREERANGVTPDAISTAHGGRQWWPSTLRSVLIRSSPPECAGAQTNAVGRRLNSPTPANSPPWPRRNGSLVRTRSLSRSRQDIEITPEDVVRVVSPLYLREPSIVRAIGSARGVAVIAR